MIDEFQANIRRRYIGASDSPAACGRSPWTTPWDLWAEKTGRRPGFKGNGATGAGTYFESGVIRWMADKLGVIVSTDQMFIHPDEIRCANLDGLILHGHEPAIVNAKTAGLFGKHAALDEWGEDGSDEIPDHVRIQTAQEFAVVDAQPELPRIDLCLVPVFIGYRGFALFRVRRNQDLVDAVGECVTSFHRYYVQADEPPPDSYPSLDTVKLLQRVPAKTVDIDGKLVADWLKAREARIQAEEQEDWTKSKMLASIGDAECGQCEDGTLTYFLQEREGYTVAPASFRVARFKKRKQSLITKGVLA